MNRTRNGRAMLLLLLTAAPALAQDDKDQAAQDERDLELVHWKWVQEVKLPLEKRDGPYLALVVPPAVFGKAQDDLRDLRLTDAKGNRVPYALRIMRSESQQTKLREARPPFNVGPSPKTRTYEMSIELAEVPPPGHNDIEIFTTGRNYRRRVEVFGDHNDKFSDPRPFFDKKTYLVLYDVDNQTVDLHRFRYDFKQFRFVLVRVHADATADEEIPKITNVIMRRSIIEPGEFVTEEADLGPYEATRTGIAGGPASAWTINLPDKMPCQKLTFEVTGSASERPFRLQIANPNEPRTDIAGAEWRWRKEEDRQLLEISFPEVIARRLRFVVTDFANEPLQFRNDGGLVKVKVTRCVRKLIFATPDETKVTVPLKLYTGNTAVGTPNFDLAKKLPAVLKPAPPLAELLDTMRANPDYQPPPQTLNERLPWLVYVVLGIACLVLLAILGALARQAIRRHDQKQAASPPTS